MDAHVLIKDRQGRVLRHLVGYHDSYINVVSRGKSFTPVLLVEMNDAGTMGLDYVYAFTYNANSGVENFFVAPGANEDFEFRDLDGDGYPELIWHDIGAFIEFPGFTRGVFGYVVRVYKWRGDRYVDMTPKFQSLSLPVIQYAQRQFLLHLFAEERYVRSRWVDGSADDLQFSHKDVMESAVVYWANELESGRGKEADTFFETHCSRKLLAWLKQERSDIVAYALSDSGMDSSPSDEHYIEVE